MKSTGDQIDDRIVEVHWDIVNSRWRMMRFRDDKPNGNFRTVVDNIIQSIAEGVEKDVVSHHRTYSWSALDNIIITSSWHGRMLSEMLGKPAMANQ